MCQFISRAVSFLTCHQFFKLITTKEINNQSCDRRNLLINLSYTQLDENIKRFHLIYGEKQSLINPLKTKPICFT
jgi:hypothetical protein